jgi:hypothetical protein
MNVTMTKVEREALLSSLRRERALIEEQELAAVTEDSELPAALRAELDGALGRLGAALDRYLQGLPVVPVSRDPLSGKILYLPVDTFGLDGPWWDYDAPVRPADRVPDTLAAFTGALRPGGPLEEMPFSCQPGPGVPYVLPHLLEQEGCWAVIAQVTVGSHTGYPVCYFAEPGTVTVERAGTWGAGSWSWVRSDSRVHSYEDDADPEAMDFELRPWLERYRLFWIAPGDPDWILREGAEGCPYLGLPGWRKPAVMQDGRIVNADEKEG